MITDLYLYFQDLLFYIFISNFSSDSKVNINFIMGSVYNDMLIG